MIFFEDIVQSLLNMCLYDACSLILTDHTPNEYKCLIKKSKRTTPMYHKVCERYVITPLNSWILISESYKVDFRFFYLDQQLCYEHNDIVIA
jgi:hypothetical protein